MGTELTEEKEGNESLTIPLLLIVLLCPSVFSKIWQHVYTVIQAIVFLEFI